MPRRVTLFELFGFAIRIDVSWVVLAVLVTWSLATGFFPYYVGGLRPGVYWWMSVAGAGGLFASILFHELGHSLVARRYGIPIRGITLFIFGGVAEMEREPPNAKSELLMAVAGPIFSLVLGGIFFGLVLGCEQFDWPITAQAIFAYLCWINWALVGFNLVPAFPLDGGRVLRAALWSWKGNLLWATRIAAAIGTGFGFLLALLGLVTLFFGNLIGGFWWILLGFFIRSASRMSYEQVLRQARFEEQIEVQM